MKNLSSSISVNPTTARNCCGYCGATSYHRVVARDETGAMRYTETLQCTGCNREFSDLQVWRQGGEQSETLPRVVSVQPH